MNRRLLLLALVPALFGVVLTVGVAVLVLAERSTVPPAPISYDRTVYTPERSALCSGESLVYTNTLKLQLDQPSIVWFNADWWSVDQQRFASPPGAGPLFRTFARQVTITARRVNVVPAGLPPGRYELWFGAQRTPSDAVTHVVPFTIRADCPRGA